MRQLSQRWRKANLIALLLTLIFGFAAFAFGKRILFPAPAAPRARVIAAPAAATPKEVEALVPDGMPLGFATATEEDNEKGHEIKATLTNKHLNKINSLAYQTYEFDPTGNLVRVEGGIKQVALEAGRQASLSIVPQRPSKAKNRLMLALEKAFGNKESWAASHLDLANAGAEKAKGKPPTPLAGKKDKDAVDEDFASGFCINAYRRAVQLAEVNGKTPPTSFTCDQTERAYAFTFRGKALVK